MKQKLLFLLVLLLTATTGTWAQDYYAPSTDEVIILNEVYNASNSGNSSHSAIAWGGTATASKKKAGDPNNGGESTEGKVNCYSVKGTGQGKNITLSITGVSTVIVYHEKNTSRYIELRDGSKTGNIIGSGEKNTNVTEVALTATNKYSIFLHGTSNGSDDQDFYVYAIELIAAPGPTYKITVAEGTEDADKWTISPAEAAAGTEVTATYNGEKKVKSVKAVKKASATLLDNTMTAWSAGTYAVPAGGLTYSDAITVSGDVTLTLTDGETLTLNKGISLASGATLTIQGNGTMNVNGTSGSTASTVAGSGTITLTSGTLTATGGNGGSVGEEGAGAAGGAAINGTVIVDGGTLTATGGNGGNVGNDAVYAHGGEGGAAISGSVTVNSGTLTATGGNGGSVGNYGYYCGGGAGSAAISGDLTINSGTVTSTNGANGQVGQDPDECSAGAGCKAVAGTVTDNR